MSEAPAKRSFRGSVGEAARQQGIDIRSAGNSLSPSRYAGFKVLAVSLPEG